jgi:hypothetical protein
MFEFHMVCKKMAVIFAPTFRTKLQSSLNFHLKRLLRVASQGLHNVLTFSTPKNSFTFNALAMGL